MERFEMASGEIAYIHEGGITIIPLINEPESAQRMCESGLARILPPSESARMPEEPKVYDSKKVYVESA